MAGYIGSRAVSVNTTSATLTDDLTIGDDLTVTDDMTVGGTLGVTGVLTATSLDISGDIDVDGTTNLDVVDIDGAVNMATTALVTGVLTTTAQAVLNGGFAAVQESTVLIADGQADNEYAFQIKNEESTDDRSYGLLIHAGSTATDRALAINTHDGNAALFYVQGNGQVLFTDGTASLPSITNNGDTNTGIFFPAADKLNLVTGGTSRIEVDDAGNVGIGGTPNVYSGYTNLTLNHATNGGIIDLELNGTVTGELFVDANGFHLYSPTSDDDITFRGNDDGGGQFTALTLDMSDGGAASFNNDVNVGANLDVTGNAVIDGTLTVEGNIESGAVLKIAGTATSTNNYGAIENSNTSLQIYASSNSGVNRPINFYHSNTGGSLSLEVLASGDVEVTKGNLVIGTAGKGIDFSATGDAGGATAELLDDYEEGTWTPAVSVGYSSPSYAIQVGRYTKVGNIVRAYFRIVLNGGTGTSDGVVFSGLPYGSVNNGSVYIVGTHYTNDASAGGENSKLLVFPDDVKIYYYVQTETGVGIISGATSGNSLDVLGQIIYESA